jgi:hypothetical protein
MTSRHAYFLSIRLSSIRFLAIARKVIPTSVVPLLLFFTNWAYAGPFPPAAGLPGSTAVAANDPNIVGWSSSYSEYIPGANVDLQFQTPSMALGEAGNSDDNNNGFTFDIVSLGEGGSITLTFIEPIGNGEGADFLVFENSFSDTFLELAWVEVSSNGVDFARFDNASLTAAPVGPFSNIDTTDILGYAGKYRGGFGTPFDLEELATSLLSDPSLDALVDTNRISHVRIVDISGDGTAFDSLAAPVGPNPIYDPYPSTGSAGFDLDAVAVMHFSGDSYEANVPMPLYAFFILGGLLVAINYYSKRIVN